MLLNADQVNHRIKTNKELLTVAKEVEEGYLPPYSEDLIVRQFYYEAELHINSSGIIEPVYRVGETDGGRPVARQDAPEYQPRAVIVKLSDKAKAEGLEEGMVVWLPYHVAMSQAYDFLIEKANLIDMPKGYKKIPYRLIEYIEKQRYTNED